MSIIKKIAIGIGILIGLGFLLYAALELIVSWLPDPCGETVLTEVISPNQMMKAVIYERDCGATTDFATHASIINKDASLKKSDRSIFAADTDHGSAPNGPGGGPEVRARWLTDTRLEIQYSWMARVILAETKVKNIECTYAKLE
jgi:hypothetical protein